MTDRWQSGTWKMHVFGSNTATLNTSNTSITTTNVIKCCCQNKGDPLFTMIKISSLLVITERWCVCVCAEL